MRQLLLIFAVLISGCDFNISDVTTFVDESCHKLSQLRSDVPGTGDVVIRISGSAADNARLTCEVTERTNASGALSRWKSWLQVCGHYEPQLAEATWCVTSSTKTPAAIAREQDDNRRPGAAEVLALTVGGTPVRDSAWYTDIPIDRGATLRLKFKIDGSYNTWAWSEIIDARGGSTGDQSVKFRSVQLFRRSGRVFLDMEVFGGGTILWVYETENPDVKITWHQNGASPWQTGVMKRL